jgi:NAD(P)-dependent dehydrogenase (short-subunit alcohol dehydrogenase family)
VVVGCYSGMGAATAAQLVSMGAEVVGVDFKESPVELAAFHLCDLRDPDSITSSVGAIGGSVDALFNCAGLPQTINASLDVMKVNFIGMRLFTEQMLQHMGPGSAIASIASSAGFDYRTDLKTTLEFIGTADFDSAVAWCEAHPDVMSGGYKLSKEAVIAWTMLMGAQLIKRGIRINCISPGPTITPMMPVFEGDIGARLVDVFTEPIGRRSTADEQAGPLIFLNSDAASYVNGENLFVDGGFTGAVTTSAIDLMSLINTAREPA